MIATSGAIVSFRKQTENPRSVVVLLKTIEILKKNSQQGKLKKYVREDNNLLIKIVDSPHFTNFFYFIIFLNSIVLAIPDFSKQDASGSLSIHDSWRNLIYAQTELFFLALFSIEAACKIVAHGLFQDGGYLHDKFNILDILVVSSGWISYFLTSTKFVTILRLVRVLRPLKVLAKTPSLKQVITVLITSVPKMGNVLGIAIFAFIFFSTAQLCTFSGPYLHTRCRLTPFPVRSDWIVGNDFYTYKCLDAPNVDQISTSTAFTQGSSPWSTPVSDCYWPVDISNTKLCSFSSNGLNACLHNTDALPSSLWRWCGSNYDAFGNPRFTDSKLMRAPEYISSLNWGHTNFDNQFRSLLVVIEVVVMDNWTDLMYFMQATFGRYVAVFCIFIVFVGGFIILNLILSTISSSIHDFNREETLRKKVEMQKQYRIINNAKDVEQLDDGEEIDATEIHFKLPRNEVLKDIEEECFSDVDAENIEKKSMEAPVKRTVERAGCAGCAGSMSCLVHWRIRFLQPLVDSSAFYFISATAVCINWLILSVYYYPMEAQLEASLRLANFILTVLFSAELVIRIFAQGLLEYFSSAFNCLDFAVVAVSMGIGCSEASSGLMWKPSNNIGGSSVIGLRLLRYLVGMISWLSPDMAAFLDQVLKTVGDVVPLFAVMILFLFVFALVGMQIFANKLRFDQDGYPIPISMFHEWQQAPDRPETNFDTFAASVAAVFQIITCDGWNVVLDDVWRSQGPAAIAYPVVVLMFGNFVLLNQLLTFIISSLLSGSSKTAGTEGRILDVQLSSAQSSLALTRENVMKASSLSWENISDGGEELRYNQNQFQLLSQETKLDEDPKSYIDDDLSDPTLNNSVRDSPTGRRNRGNARPQYNLDEMDLDLDSGQLQHQCAVTQPQQGVISNFNNVLPSHFLSMWMLVVLNHFLVMVVSAVAPQQQQQQQQQPEPKQKPANEPCATTAEAVGGRGQPQQQEPSPRRQHTKHDVKDKEEPYENSLDTDGACTEHAMIVSRNETRSKAARSKRLDKEPVNSKNGQFAIQNHDEEEARHEDGEEGANNQTKNKQQEQQSIYPIQKYLKAVTENFFFEKGSLLLVVVSSVILLVQNPLSDPMLPLSRVLEQANYIVTIMFCMENALLIAAQGPVIYFSSLWQASDFVVTVISMAGIYVSSGSLKSIRVLKVLRSLRALQMAKSMKGLRRTLAAIAGVTIPAMGLLVLFTGILYLFSIFCVACLKGQLRSCQGGVFEEVLSVQTTYMQALQKPISWQSMSINERELFGPSNAVFSYFNLTSEAVDACGGSWPSTPCCYDRSSAVGAVGPVGATAAVGAAAASAGKALQSTSRSYCECWGGEWLPYSDQLFDNVAQSMLSLAQIAVASRWVEVMHHVTASTGVGMEPVKGASQGWIAFFVLFMIVANMLCLNLFVAYVVDAYNRTIPPKERNDRDAFAHPSPVYEENWVVMFLEAGQKEAANIEVSKILINQWKPIPDEELLAVILGPVRTAARDISSHPWFDQLMLGVVFANTLVLAMSFFGSKDTYNSGLEQANFVFGILYNVELAIKLLADGRAYFALGSNCFDFCIVIGTDITMIFQSVTQSKSATAVSLGRVARMVKVSRMLKIPQLQRLLVSLIAMIPAVVDVGIVTMYLLFVYAVIGVQVFATVAYYKDYNEYVNFRSFPVALLSMFTFATDSHWDKVMRAAAHSQPGCLEYPTFNASYCGFSDHIGCIPLNGCGNAGIYFFMLSFQVIVGFVAMNLFIAVVLASLELSDEGSMFDSVRGSKRTQFTRAWLEFDPSMTGFISLGDLVLLERSEDNPFKHFDPDGLDSGRVTKFAWALSEGLLPIPYRIGHGCLFGDVFKATLLSADGALIAMTADLGMNLEAEPVLGRLWFSMREVSAANQIIAWWTTRSRRMKYKMFLMNHAQDSSLRYSSLLLAYSLSIAVTLSFPHLRTLRRGFRNLAAFSSRSSKERLSAGEEGEGEEEDSGAVQIDFGGFDRIYKGKDRYRGDDDSNHLRRGRSRDSLHGYRSIGSSGDDFKQLENEEEGAGRAVAISENTAMVTSSSSRKWMRGGSHRKGMLSSSSREGSTTVADAVAGTTGARWFVGQELAHSGCNSSSEVGGDAKRNTDTERDAFFFDGPFITLR